MVRRGSKWCGGRVDGTAQGKRRADAVLLGFGAALRVEKMLWRRNSCRGGKFLSAAWTAAS
ncbi:hypothetical protein PLANPX_0386 [Lacipirellula parvula]|uniref:Uncharacterized protein n=1 Tax=Lacipirellula parvula TaxID=2650471 RepID=A0A5K7X299_9BACT|nr:hypothetical protein PLANPX_0386 [Lacipirellula parvula]